MHSATWHRQRRRAVVAGLAVAGLAALHPAASRAGAQAGAAKPNVLWLTCEDMSPTIGPYGDRYAVTPNLDRLAARSLRYDRVWSCAPVCAPARTTLISGLYPTATGSEHMRSSTRLPAALRMYPELLREAGYYCTNNSKEDYNLEKTGRVWDESSPRAHWKNRPAGQPFFAIFNDTITHESQIRKRPHALVHDPAGVRVPAYHPDTPEVRHDWAQYYDNITPMDTGVGARLRELEEAGLADDTLVFFYSDHGSGMPRSKRWPYNSGLRVPLLVHVPPKFRHLAPADYAPGGATRRLVSFVDFAPTLLSLVGLRPPDWMQGHAFLGAHAAPPQPFVYGFRGRMDERIDMVRSVWDGRCVYLRQYHPHRIYGQHVSYMFETPTTRVWRQRFDAGTLTPAQRRFWQEKPAEELYDLETDPDEVHNLAESPAHRGTLERLRRAQRELALQIRDVGFLPESEIHRRAAGSTPYEMGRDAAKYPLERILETAELAAGRDAAALPRLRAALTDSDSAVRYWAATGFLIRGRAGVDAGGEVLRAALADPSPTVRVPAAEALARYGGEADRSRALETLLAAAAVDRGDVYTAVQALNALDELDERARPVLAALRALRAADDQAPPRARGYVARLLEKILADLQP